MNNPAHLETSETERRPRRSAWAIEFVDETDSTQTDLLARADAGVLGDRTALRTDFQRRGRGRLDRAWGAPPGANLLVSLAFTTVPADPAELMRRVGVAAVDAVSSFVAPEAARATGLKWPNDLLIGERKAAGMLAQRAGTGPVVVGLGLNVGWAPHGATSIADHCAGQPPRPAEVLAVLLERLDDDVDSDDLLTQYRSRLITLGQQVRADLGAERVEGVAVAVGVGGELIVRTPDGDRRTLTVGDVNHLRALAEEER